MSVQLLVLAAIAIFLVLRLRSVLGTREGFEKPVERNVEPTTRPEFTVVEGGLDNDIADHVDPKSASGEALAHMKDADPSFSVNEFLSGGRQAYEMILMAFENGDIQEVRGFLDQDVAEAFDDVIAQRQSQGFVVDATFYGVREMKLVEATFEHSSKNGEITVSFTGELTSVVKNSDGEVVAGDAKSIKRQKDVWTFAKDFRSGDPNWQLVATDG